MPEKKGHSKGRVPPNNIEAEQSVLGSMLLNEKCVYEALEALRADDFYHQQNRDIFYVMSELMAAGIPVDIVTVSQKLDQEGKMRAGTMEYLSGLTTVVPSVANLRHYIDIVDQKSSMRKLIGVSMDIADDCFAGEQEADEIVGRAGDAIYRIALKNSKSSVVSLKEAVQESYMKISEAMKTKDGLMGVPTGFARMDKMLSGFQGTQLIVVAGRPGMGKTSFALNIVEHVGVVKNMPCLVFSLEMSADQLATRLLCSEANVDSQLIRSGEVNATQITKIADAMKVLSNAPIYIDDSSVITVTEMLAKAHRMQKQLGLSLVVIDYLQLMQGSGRAENRQQEISQITRSLKIMAKELNVPIVLLSQLSRATEKREKSKTPMLSDLRESGAIEQDADVVIFLQRDDYYLDETTPENKGMARIIIAKQRSGPTGDIPVKWREEYTKYVEVDYVRDDEGGDGAYYGEPEY